MPWAAILAFIVIALHEWIVFPLLIPALTPLMGSRDLPMWQSKARWMAELTEPLDVVFLGDSKLLGGLDAEEISKRTGLSAYNLALGGMQAPGQYFALKRLIARGKVPRLVFYGPSPYLFNNSLGGEFSQRFIRWFISPSEFLELLPDLFSLGKEGIVPIREYIIRTFMPTFSYRYELRALVRGVAEGTWAEHHAYWKEIVRTLTAGKGFRVWKELDTGKDYFAEHPIEAEFIRDPHSPRLFVFSPHALNVLYLKKLFDLCRDRGISVMWALGPIPQSLQQKRIEIGYNNSLKAFVNGALAANAEVSPQEPMPLVFADDLFLDTSHLSEAGAREFTEQVAGWLLKNIPREGKS